MKLRDFAAAFACVLAVSASAALAQPFPSKPLRFIVPYPPGGGTDILGRALGQLIGESVGQPVIVDNRPGANGAVGSDIVAKSPPDGYTVGFAGSSTHVLNPLLYKLSYDPVKDFTPITTVATTSFVVVVKPDASPPYQYNSLRELIGYLKANSGKVSYASFGNASAGHLAGEMFKYMASLDMVHIPYKGSAPGQADVMAGHVPVMFSDMYLVPGGAVGRWLQAGYAARNNEPFAHTYAAMDMEAELEAAGFADVRMRIAHPEPSDAVKAGELPSQRTHYMTMITAAAD